MGPTISSITKPLAKGLSFIPGVSTGINKARGIVSGLNKKSKGIIGKTFDFAHELSPVIANMGGIGKGVAAGIEGVDALKDLSKEAGKQRSITNMADIKDVAKDIPMPKTGMPGMTGMRNPFAIANDLKNGKDIKSSVMNYAKSKIRKSGDKFISSLGIQAEKKPKMGNPHPLSTTQPIQRMPSTAESHVERNFI